MPDYKKLYFKLFNSLTDAIEAFEHQNYGSAREILLRAQQAAEEDYMEAPEDGENEE